MSRSRRTALAALAALYGFGAVPAMPAAEPPLSALTLVGPAATIFSSERDACDEADVPDAPLRAFRDAAGGLVAFGLHYRNRVLRGPDLEGLRIDCRVVLESGEKADPALYDDRSWITATWTEDGRDVAAILHHEYQANEHRGRCRSKVYMACWYNTLTAAASTDGGARFLLATPPAVVAGAPFRQEVNQGRHRGFFNPSNIVADGADRYFLASTTGWERPGSDQSPGVCLFRSGDPADPASWRAWTGTGFAASFPDPYRMPVKRPDTCKPVGPFPGPVGALVRHRASGAWIAVFMAKTDDDAFRQSGFYWTTSRDLIAWDVPRLLMPGATLYDDPCTAKGGLIAYPSILDPAAKGRNFDDVGDGALLTYTTLKVEGCDVGDRDLVRRPLAIKVWP